MVKLHLGAIVYGRDNSAAPAIRSEVVDRRLSEMYRLRVSFRDRNRNPDVLDPADGRLEQDAKNKKSRAIPYRVVHGVIVTVIVNRWKSWIWWGIRYINLQCRGGPYVSLFSRQARANLDSGAIRMPVAIKLRI